MSSLLLSLPDLFNAYKNWVSKNPQNLTDYETTAKWLSYLIAGRINNSEVLSELIYFLSNLLVLFNDRIIAKASKLELPDAGNKIKVWLTVLEYSEVFCELSAKKLWGTTGKWLVVIAIQVLKCISRLILVYKYKENIIQCPPIPALMRKNIPNLVGQKSVGEIADAQFNEVSFTLKRSGRIVRKVDASPPVNLRNWKPLQRSRSCENVQTIEQALAGRQLIAETIYIAKPLVHLASLGCFGTNSWKPWIASFLMDLTSLQLYSSCKTAKINSLTPKQKLQLSKRTVALILYLVRSPFYDKYSKDRIESFIMALSNTVPLASLICKPLAQYLPFWQEQYFYKWST